MLYVLKSDSGFYLAGSDTGICKKKINALYFANVNEAETELSIMRKLGIWPLMNWKICCFKNMDCDKLIQFHLENEKKNNEYEKNF